MLITLISILLLVFGAILWHVEDKNFCTAILSLLGVAFSVFGAIFTVLCIVLIIDTHLFSNVTIQKNDIKYESLCKQYECLQSDYENVSDVSVYENIVEWNSYVIESRAFLDNPFTSWFVSKNVVDNLQTIEY